MKAGKYRVDSLPGGILHSRQVSSLRSPQKLCFSPHGETWDFKPKASVICRAVAPQSAETETHQTFRPDPEATGTAEIPSTSDVSFSWEKHWYPVAVLDALDPEKPFPFALLGLSYVIWRDGNGQWRCLEDKCPHRLAPLSEGRVDPESGNLMCSYHGWAFNGEGKCVSIPQAKDKAAEELACSSGRACAASYPTQVLQGLVWIWPETGPQAFIESCMHVPAMPPEFSGPVDKDPSFVSDWFVRDLPYSYDALVENLLDPSHVPFSHHGVMGPARREKAKSMRLDVVSNPETLEGVRYTHDGHTILEKSVTQDTMFQAPSLYRAETKNEDGTSMVLHFYATPTGPNRARMFARFFTTRKFPFMNLLTHAAVRWYGHLRNMEVLDGDSIILARQAARLCAQAGDWKQQYYMPTSADGGVVAFRQWFHGSGQSGPVWPHALHTYSDQGGPEVPREVLLDRWGQHTKDCPSCRAAESASRNGAIAASGMCLSCIALAGWAAAGGSSGPTCFLLLAASAVLGAAARSLGNLNRQFHFVDYVHSER